MKYYLISDNVDTQTGMRLAGVEGITVHEKKEFEDAFDAAVADKEIAVLLITERLMGLSPAHVRDQKLNNKLPLIVEIPDRHGSTHPDDYILSYVKEAIGVNL